jgi:23S rRNA (uracil1939-C5)-methyltransferase
VEINDIVKMKCIDLNHQGLGVCKPEGIPVFVPGLLVDEVADVKITKFNKSYYHGEIEHIHNYSEDRVEPICPVFGICGGCEIMHMKYDAQLKFKVKMAEETFKRIGRLDNVKVDEIIGMEDPYYYRNKVQIPFRMKKGRVICGFFKKGSHDIVQLDKCFIQPLEATEIAKEVRDLFNHYKIPAYNEISKKGNLKHLLLRKTVSNEYMVVLITKYEEIPFISEIIEKLVNKFPNIKTVIQNINPKETNVILGRSDKVLYGPATLIEELMGNKFVVSYKSFFQTNHIQTEKLYSKVLEYADVKKDDVIVDGYCGVGTISLLLAKEAKKVYGIEIVDDAIMDAKANAMLNGVENVEFIVGKTEDKIKEFNDIKVKTIVVDPPRKGCDRSLLDTIIEKKIEKMVYVSCDVATLARDLEILSPYYEIKNVTLVDMFPQIADVEACVLLELK